MVELKSVEKLLGIHEAQLLTCMKMAEKNWIVDERQRDQTERWHQTIGPLNSFVLFVSFVVS